MDEATDWARGLNELVERIAPRSRRIEPRRRVRAYLQGLLAPIERKNGWQLAESASDRAPDGAGHSRPHALFYRMDPQSAHEHEGIESLRIVHERRNFSSELPKTS